MKTQQILKVLVQCAPSSFTKVFFACKHKNIKFFLLFSFVVSQNISIAQTSVLEVGYNETTTLNYYVDSSTLSLLSLDDKIQMQPKLSKDSIITQVWDNGKITQSINHLIYRQKEDWLVTPTSTEITFDSIITYKNGGERVSASVRNESEPVDAHEIAPYYFAKVPVAKIPYEGVNYLQDHGFSVIENSDSAFWYKNDSTSYYFNKYLMIEEETQTQSNGISTKTTTVYKNGDNGLLYYDFILERKLFRISDKCVERVKFIKYDSIYRHFYDVAYKPNISITSNGSNAVSQCFNIFQNTTNKSITITRKEPSEQVIHFSVFSVYGTLIQQNIELVDNSVTFYLPETTATGVYILIPTGNNCPSQHFIYNNF